MSRRRLSFSFATGLVFALLFLILSFPWPGIARVSSVTPGPYLALALKPPLTPTPTPTLTPTPSYGILLISEVLVHPDGVEPDGEWIELYNSGGASINLSSYKLGDEETRGGGEGMFMFPPGASLAPGQTIVVADKAASFYATYGIYPNYELVGSSPAVPDMRKYNAWAGGSVSLVNSGDEVLVLNGSDALVDAISWGDSSWAFYPPCGSPGAGWSLERYPANQDTDTALDWRAQPNPAPGSVDITPPTATPTHTPTRTRTRTITPSPTASLTPTQTFLPTHTPTSTPTHTPDGSVTPIQDDTPTQTFTITPTPTSSTQPSLTPTASPTVTRTPRPTPTGDWLLISEVLYDPVGLDTDHEWIELYNAGDTDIDLSSYKVGDEERRGENEGMFRFPDGSTLASRQVIIIADRADVFTDTYGFYPDYELAESDPNVPTMVQYADWSFGIVDLNNLGDEVLVLDGGDQVADAVSWGKSKWAFDPSCPQVAEGHSIARVPADVDTDTAADWVDQAAPDPGIVEILRR